MMKDLFGEKAKSLTKAQTDSRSQQIEQYSVRSRTETDDSIFPKISIVTPSYNQGKYLEATILSVLLQEYSNIEYMIIDGGSTDASQDVIKKHQNGLAFWMSEPDRGQSDAINKGLKKASGEILGWLNSDDVLLPLTVSHVVEYFQNHPEIDVVYGRLDRIDEKGDPVPTPILPKDQVEFDRNTAIGESVVNQPGCFWRRRIMDKVGFLNEDLHYALDYEYWVRMLLAGGKFKRLDQSVANFRLSSDSKTVGSTAEAAIEHMKVTEGFLADPQFPAKLGLPPETVARQARRSKAVQCIYATWGLYKTGKSDEALKWLLRGLRYDPTVIAQRRWIDLAIAKSRRQ